MFVSATLTHPNNLSAFIGAFFIRFIKAHFLSWNEFRSSKTAVL